MAKKKITVEKTSPLFAYFDSFHCEWKSIQLEKEDISIPFSDFSKYAFDFKASIEFFKALGIPTELLEVRLKDEIKNVRDVSITEFTDEEIKRVLDFYSPKEEEITDIKESSIPLYYKTPRELTKQMTRGRKRGENLYSLLINEDDKETAMQFEQDGKLLSTLTSGIVVSALENKVIKAIQKHLYAQSKGYDREDGDGLPEEIIRANIGENYDKNDLKNSSFVCLYPFKFTQEVLGKDDIGGADVTRVIGALRSLHGKFAYDDKEKAFYPLITIEKIGLQTKKRAGQIFVACRAIFRKGLKNNFINTRADELKLLAGISSDLSLRLYDVLKELESYNTPTQRNKGYIQIGKTALLERVAVKKSYDNQRKRIDTDFYSAVEDMKKIGIITKAVEAENNIHFYISPNWRKRTEEAETKISIESQD